jgi:hypothetical protein
VDFRLQCTGSGQIAKTVQRSIRSGNSLKRQFFAIHLNNVAGSSVIVVIKYYFEITKAANIKKFLLHQDICRILKNGVDYNFGFLQGSIPSFGQSFDKLRFIYFALLLPGLLRGPHRGW